MRNLDMNYNRSKTRPLGYVESIHYILNSYIHILRNVVISIEFEKSFSSDLIIGSLKSAHQKFVALQTKIQEKNHIPYFLTNVDFTSIPINIITNDSIGTESLVVEIEDEMNTPIASEEFMWRAKILLKTDCNLLILTFHHSIFDGKSINKLINHFELTHTLSSNELSMIYPAIENHADTASIDNSLENNRQSSLKLWELSQECMIKNQKSKCKKIDVDYLDVNLLKNYSQKFNVSVNHILNALVIKAISMLANSPSELVIHTPVDLTQNIENQEYKEEIGCFIAIVHSIMKNFKNKSLLDIAQCYRDEFARDLTRSNVSTDYDFSNLKSNLMNKYTNITKLFSGGIAVSNIGLIKFTKDKIQTAVKKIFFTTSLFGGLGIFVLSALTQENKFRLMLSYTSPLLSEGFVTSFIAAFELLCVQLAKEIAK
jgi:hypothetical protein